MCDCPQVANKEIWRKNPDDPKSPCIEVTYHPLIVLVVDGKTLQMGVEDWHALFGEVCELKAAFELEKRQVEQYQVQLAGCLVAAEGHAVGNNDANKGDYGWSVAFDVVKDLRAEVEKCKRYECSGAEFVREGSTEWEERCKKAEQILVDQGEYVAKLKLAIADAMSEIGVPGEGYPGNIANAYAILSESIRLVIND